MGKDIPIVYHQIDNTTEDESQIILHPTENITGIWNSGIVECMCISNNNHTIISGGSDGYVNVWNILDKSKIIDFNAHIPLPLGGVCCLCLSKDEKFIFSSGYDGFLKVWSNEIIHEIACLKKSSKNFSLIWINHLAVSTNILAAGFTNGKIRIYSLESKTLIQKFIKNSEIKSLLSDSEGNYFISKINNMHHFDNLKMKANQISVLNYSFLIFLNREKKNIAFAVEGSSELFICSEGYDIFKPVMNINAKSQESDPITCTYVSYNSKIIITGSEYGKLGIWSIKECLQKYNIPAHNSKVSTVTATYNCLLIISGGDDAIIKVFDFIKPILKCNLEGHHIYQKRGISCLQTTLDDKYLISSGFDGTIRMWNLMNFKQEVIFHGHSGFFNFGVSCSIENKNLKVSGGYNGSIRIWQKNPFVLIKEFTESDTYLERNITCVAFFNKINMIASGDKNGNVQIWNIQKKSLDSVLTGQGCMIEDIAISKNDKYLISGSRDGDIFIWNLKRKCIHSTVNQQNPLKKLTFLTTDTLFVSSSFTNVLTVWNIKDELFHLKILHNHRNNSLAMTKNNKYLISSGIEIYVLKIPLLI